LHDDLQTSALESIKIREWVRPEGLLDLQALLGEQGIKILLLPRGGLNNFGSLGSLKDRLAYHYALITTEQGLDQWHIRKGSEEETRFWCRPDWQSYFGREHLRQVLGRELDFRGAAWPGADQPPPGDHDPLAGVTPGEVVEKLRDPGCIKEFVAMLPAPPRQLSQEGVRSLLEDSCGDRQQAGRWYRAQDERQQLLAIGLILFDGLPVDQVFAGVETLVDKVFRRADPLLAHFDYLDAERLGRYFKREQSGGDGRFTIIKEQRQHILEVAWQLHRRRILASLPAIAEMMHHASVFLEGLDVDPGQVGGAVRPPAAAGQDGRQGQSAGSSDGAADRKLLWRMSEGRARELYGTIRRMAGLQEAMVESLSKIGGMSSAAFEAIEPCLRELAADESRAVRAVIAGVLAKSTRWMKTGPGQRPLLFGKLNEWWQEACQPSEGLSNERRKEVTAIRATVALTVGRAAGLDPENGMEEDLLRLLRQLVEDRFPEVRGAVKEILFEVIARHLRQLEELVRGRIAEQDDLLEVAAHGVARAYSERPQETSRLLVAWRDLAYSKTASQGGGGPANVKLLSLVARALGYLRTNEQDPELPPARIFGELRAILAANRDPRVRHHALVAVGYQALRDYEGAAPLLVELLAEVSLADRSILLWAFTRAYLDQRRRLGGGDETIQIGDERYPVWTRAARPLSHLTGVEQALYFWLQGWDQPVAQQVAAEAFAALTATALDRRERQLAVQRAQASPEQPVAALPAPAVQPVLLRVLGPLGWLALAAVARGRELRSALWAPFAELLWLLRRSSAGTASPADTRPFQTGPAMASVEELLQRWRGEASNDSLRSLVDHLERALRLYRWRWAAVVSASWLLIVLMKIVASHH
jgi:hypothetical protein